MPDVNITIGNREFEVACQDGEEHFLRAAATMLDTEAQTLVAQIRHLTESRMLLMAGLMLADKTAGIDDNLKLAEKRIAELEAQLAEAQNAAKAARLPEGLADTMAEIAARAEAIAMAVEEKAAG
ncbi:cell division protein ZapA [Maritimibacter sp. HL-12]|jgi:cell division protein ZapA|uniref:cell division protein ZapA n=1 Tax=Maritimibacter sp. HL-12 TaxID=1162418 RepID=UPI000A0F2E26|nr:cell division protein ZapA [Maritimibacter sp. HL-12]SMH57724.1 cell division protein ZapA [Maritimibacter sp. HL-12]